MCAFTYTYMCVCTWYTCAIGKRVHTYVYGHMYMQACMHVWAHICTGMYAHMGVHVYYMNTRVRPFTGMCACMCVWRVRICYVYVATHGYRYVYTRACTLAQIQTCTPPCPPSRLWGLHHRCLLIGLEKVQAGGHVLLPRWAGVGTAYLGLLQVSSVSPEEGNHDAISYNNDTSHCIIVHVLQNIENRSTESLKGSTATQHHEVSHGPTHRRLSWVTWPAPGTPLSADVHPHPHPELLGVQEMLPAPGPRMGVRLWPRGRSHQGLKRCPEVEGGWGQ